LHRNRLSRLLVGALVILFAGAVARASDDVESVRCCPPPTLGAEEVFLELRLAGGREIVCARILASNFIRQRQAQKGAGSFRGEANRPSPPAP
jgi:hypothetical protein